MHTKSNRPQRTPSPSHWQDTAPGYSAAAESFVSRQQAAQLLSVSLSTIDKLIETGQLPAFRVLRVVRPRLSDVMNAAVPR